MTAFEQIKAQFESRVVCRFQKQTPRLHYEPGCLFIECDLADACKCRMNDGDNRATTPILAEWQRRFA